MTARFHNDVQSTERVAVYAGSFDPFTVGHLSVLERALPLFDRIVIAVGYNSAKPGHLNVENRVETIRQIVDHLPGVYVRSWDGLTVDLARAEGAQFLLRGIRNSIDFEYEYNLATMNRNISGIETIFIPTLPEHAAISSSVVRELERFGHDITPFIP